MNVGGGIPLERVYLYSEPRCQSLHVEEIARYLRDNLGERVEVIEREDFWATTLRHMQRGEIEAVGLKWAQSRVLDPASHVVSRQPLPQEVIYEVKRLTDTGSRAWGILYDAWEVVKIALDLLPIAERSLRNLHVLFTNQLIATWEALEGRYHAMVAAFALPCVISTTGIAVAPARDRGWYALKYLLGRGLEEVGLAFDEINRLEVDDEKLTEVCKGLVLQCVFYHLTGNPFCDDHSCRLYNAHWQREMVYAQLRPGACLCKRHRQMLQQAVARWSTGRTVVETG
ncbi:MAG TPA: hypothetical protein GX507_02430 [Clostridia bacterium]|nr:hypothetical protein [Clostridia bacterium]